MPKISPTQTFYRDLLCLPAGIQERVWKAIDILSGDPHHPSLRVKKLKGTEGIWEARISRGYRLTFEMKGDTYILRRVGTHGILKKED